MTPKNKFAFQTSAHRYAGVPVLVFLLGISLVLSAQERSVSFTFDDLPVTGHAESYEYAKSITDKLIAGLEKEKIPAIGFVNEKKLFFPGEIDKRTALLEQWLAAGHELGNHTFSHIFINGASFEQYKEDLIRGETVTRMLLKKRGMKLKYFRHTQLRTGPTDDYRMKLNALIKNRGYVAAPVTIDSNEYLFAVKYAEASAKSDEALRKRIAADYIEYMENVTKHFEKLSKDFLEYEVPQILLLHANGLNSDYLDSLAAMYRRRGYRFITLDEALKDIAYTLPEVTSRRGLSWIHRWMLAKGLKMKEEPGVPDWIN
jgi:peptidoglycan/xylan/chitin deacetylase (PgdA/CDA1 family)